MKKIFKVLSFTVILTLCIVLFCFSASAYNENGILYSVSGGEATVTGADETVTGDIVIPSTLGGYPVTAIDDYAFEYNYDITSVVIPEGVETIGKYCFCNCDWLEEIRFPSTLKYIGNRAFDDDCFIRELYIADIASYTQIEYESLFSHPFWYGDEDGFEWWEEEYEKKLYIGNSTEPATDIIIPEGVEKISAYAFYGNTFLKSVTLPDTLTGIGAEAFYKCENLESVSFGHCLEHIEASAFECCYKLGNFTLPDSLLTIGEWAFSGNYAMTEVTIPDKVREIPLGTFSYCEALAEVNIGSGVEVIGQEAFENIAATEFIIPDNVKSLGNHLFYGSEKLETVVIGNGITQAGDWMFNECYNLKNVTLGDGLTELSDKFFKIYEHVDDTKDKWIKLERLDTGDGITALPTEVLDGNILKEIVIGDGITSLADYQFAYYSKLEKAILGDNITAIGDNTFYRCTNLSEFKMPEKLESIGNSVFTACSSLPAIVIPEMVVSIGNSAFSGCSAAETVTFEGTALKTLGDTAFSGCSALTSITIPDGVTYIGSHLFYWCENLREINLPDSITSIKSGIIYYTPYDEDYDYYEDMLYIGNHLINAGYYNMPAKYTVRKGTKSIAQYAFSNQHSLEAVVIHKGLVSMADDIFNDCPNLTKIGFTGTEAEWNAILKGNNDFSAYDIEFNYYVCPHESTENKEAVAPGCYTYGYTEGIYCNDCGEWLKGHRQLAMSHKDNDGDAVCDDCQAVVSDIVIDEYKTVGSGDFEDDLTFVAPATGKYTIVSFSEGVIDPYVDLVDSEYVSIDGNDEQDDDYNNDNYDFSLTCTLEKGKTYHFIITALCEGEFQVLLTFDCEHTGGTATCKEKAECVNCGMKYGERLSHSFTDYKSDNNATYTSDGTKTALCDNGCGEKKTVTDVGSKLKTLGKVTGIAATQSTSSIKLTWKAVAGATGYRVYEYNKQTGKYTTLGTLQKLDGTIKNLKAGTTYGYLVRAYKQLSDGTVIWADYSASDVFYTATLPDKVSGITATQSTSSIKLTWKAVTGATGYRVYEYNKQTGKYTTLGTLQKLNGTIKNLKSGTTHGYLVRAYIQLSDGTVLWAPYSASDVFYTATLPDKVSGITATQSTSAIKLTWKAVTGATGYRVYRYDKATGKYTTLGTLQKLNGTIKNLKAGTTYGYLVRAYIQLSDGTVLWAPYSASDVFYTATKAVAPTLKATAGTKKFTLSWNKVAGATGYEIWYATSANGTYKKLTTVTGTTYSRSCTTGKTYYLKIRAITTVNGQTINGEASTAKGVKIK